MTLNFSPTSTDAASVPASDAGSQPRTHRGDGIDGRHGGLQEPGALLRHQVRGPGHHAGARRGAQAGGEGLLWGELWAVGEEGTI